MTRSELVQKLIQTNPELKMAQAEKSLDIILDEIISALAKGNRVELRGFGVFSTRERDPRIGRNPRTGQPVNVKSKNVPFFKAGKELQERLNS
ncbi:MAG: integration host factor subunit beta [Janthinobacterium lividum]